MIADFSWPGESGRTLPINISSARIAPVARILNPQTVTPLSFSLVTLRPALSPQSESPDGPPTGVATASVPRAPAGGTTAYVRFKSLSRICRQ